MFAWQTALDIGSLHAAAMALVTVDDYALGAQLGQGTYGQVFSARKKAGRARNFPDVIAVKRISTTG